MPLVFVAAARAQALAAALEQLALPQLAVASAERNPEALPR